MSLFNGQSLVHYCNECRQKYGLPDKQICVGAKCDICDENEAAYSWGHIDLIFTLCEEITKIKDSLKAILKYYE